MPNFILAINREYGSGGRLIGRRVAEELGIGFYDKELIALAAEESGMSENVIQANEDTRSSAFAYLTSEGSLALPIPEQVFVAQSNVIRRIAETESAVIIGRCAGYVLKDNPYAIKAFVHAPFDYRVAFAKARYESQADMAAYVKRTDRQRKSYYEYYTQEEWGDAEATHLTVNSSIGVEETAQLLIAYYKIFTEQF